MFKKQLSTTKRTSPKRLTQGNIKQKKMENDLKPIIEIPAVAGKENLVPFRNSVPKTQFTSDDRFHITPLNLNIRRETYTVNDVRFSYIKEDLKNISDDSLEMSPNFKVNLPLKRRNNCYSISENCLTKENLKTYKLQPLSSVSENELANIGLETSPLNLSSATYVKGNVSSETYIKGNLSSETYVKDEPLSRCSPTFKNTTWTSRRSSSLIGNLSPIEDDINLSPIYNQSDVHRQNMSGKKIRSIIEANLWGKDVSNSVYRQPLKRKSDVTFDISPAKKPYFESTRNTTVANRNLDWNKTKKIQKGCNVGSSCFDPFLSDSVYYNREWMEKQDLKFKNWLNALLTPPVELDSNVDDQPINVAKLWQECKQISVPIAPSRENVSSKYHTNHRLDSLRKTALSLFKSSEVSDVLVKIMLNIENEKLSVRLDRNVHLDLGLQSEIMTLLLSYNPLWLRIGLETIYSTCIDLHSNSDIMGLSKFLMQNFFKDSSLLQKYKTIHSPKYAQAIKKFILKKFLGLIYFLDVAKCKVLIGHDPCLFRKTAPVKESREIILGFSRELLSSVGDVTRLLRFMGYVVNHKQTFIQEFNYSVIHLSVDLRDGVRLIKVMEIILMRKDLTERLRVPAVSRLQKIHNMKVVFEALLEANFEIVGEIEPKDIVDGHHEKTLSFLWQIVYKFQAPFMVNASIKIQNWWKSLPIVLKRRTRTKLRMGASIKIQRWYRRHLFALKLIKMIPLIQDILKQKLLRKSAIIIQSVVRMHLQKKKYKQLRRTVECLQNRGRGYLLRKSVKHKLQCIVTIQSYVRMFFKRKQYLQLRASVIFIQQIYRAKQVMQKQREKYQTLKASTVLIQNWYRRKCLMKVDRARYLTMKAAAIVVQMHFKAFLLMRFEKNKYLQIRCACITIQTYFRSYQIMKQHVREYGDLRRAVLIIQRRFRANRLMKSEKLNYLELKNAVLVVQSRFRANRRMRLEYTYYKNLKKAVLYIETVYKATQFMKIEQSNFNRLKSNTICMQRRYRATSLMKLERLRYMKVKSAALVIQRYFKAYLLMKATRTNYQRTRNAVVILQAHIRAYWTMKENFHAYTNLKRATICIQRKFRARRLMMRECACFNTFKAAVIFVQRKFRANRIMRVDRTNYQNLRKAAVSVQQRYRANQLRKIEYEKFGILRRSAVSIQRHFRANKLMKMQRCLYDKLREAAIIFQRRFRAKQLMQAELVKFTKLKNAVSIIQCRFRALRLMRIERTNYKRLQKAILILQTRYRAKKKMQLEMTKYLQVRNATIIIQRRVRACSVMKKNRCQYHSLKSAAVLIQSKYRAVMLMRLERSRFIKLREATILIQQIYRATKLMKIEMERYQLYKSKVVYIQLKFKASRAMRVEKENYQNLRRIVISMQKRVREKQIRKLQYTKYHEYENTVITIQRRFRAQQLMKVYYFKFRQIKSAVVIIQRQWRHYIKYNHGYKLKKLQEHAAIRIQAFWRGCRARKNHPEIHKIRQNVEHLTLNTSCENTLGNRKERAIRNLSESSTLFQVLHALEDLDFITRRCRNTLISMSETLPEQLYIFVSSANRSPAEMELSTVAVSVLINFYKYHETAKDAWVPSQVSNLVTVMSHCCDKDDKLFPYLCTLIWLFAHNPEYKEFICSLPMFRSLFTKINTLCLRKQKMVSRMNSYMHSYFRPDFVPTLPLLTPDWGLDYIDRPRTFTNSIEALNCVLTILDFSI